MFFLTVLNNDVQALTIKELNYGHFIQMMPIKQKTVTSFELTFGRVLNTVSISANHSVKKESVGSKDPVAVGKKNESPSLEIQKQISTFGIFHPIVYVALCKPARPRASHDLEAVGKDTARRS